MSALNVAAFVLISAYWNAGLTAAYGDSGESENLYILIHF